MKVIVRSMKNEFNEYVIEDVLTTHFFNGALVIVYSVEGKVKTATYSANDVLVETVRSYSCV